MMYFFFPILILGGLLACSSGDSPSSPNKTKAASENKVPQSDKTDLPLHTLKLPKGFKIDVYAQVLNARSLALGSRGTVFVGNRAGDKVYALRDDNQDGKAENVYVVAEKLNMPCGVAFRQGSLYVAEVNRVLRFDDIENKLASPPAPVVVYDKFPTDKHHGWKFIAFGPDDKLYVPVGAPCNICNKEDEQPIYASIARLNADGSGLEIFAKGVRNSVGFDWHPQTKELWFTDNGRDWLGDDSPECELNCAPKAGLHFGYPYCHAGEVSDPDFGKQKSCSEFVAPRQKMGAHTAPIGMRFYTGKMFPKEYADQAFVARHGSWNRSRKSGYDLSLIKIVEGKAQGIEPFVYGWLDEDKQKAWGRPVDVLVLPDGSMLVSDDTANVVYRITYAP